MNYTHQYFGKEIDELTYEDLENYFCIEREESDKIEYKSYFSYEDKNHTEKERGVIRTVSAFLNSDGGILIWGAPVGQTKTDRKEKVYIGELSLVSEFIEKDSFINKLTDSITPAPNKIRFHRISKEAKFIYVIEVEQSEYSPHQYKNNYYMRIDGQSRIAPHHYIEALFRKIKYPRLMGYLGFENYSLIGQNYLLNLILFIHNKSKLQNEYDIYITLTTSNGRINIINDSPKNLTITYNKGQMQIYIQGAKDVLYYNEPIIFPISITYSPYDLEQTNRETEIKLIFGGKLSPLKYSKYKLKLHTTTANANQNVILFEENKLFSEDEAINGSSEQEMISRILKRNF